MLSDGSRGLSVVLFCPGEACSSHRCAEHFAECIADSGAERMRVASMVGVDSVLRSVFQHVVRV